jgi:hypothetical protein
MINNIEVGKHHSKRNLRSLAFMATSIDCVTLDSPSESYSG